MSEPDIWQLHIAAEQHPGLSAAGASSLCASACVCLSRHHTSPTRFNVQVDDTPADHVLVWPEPTPRDRNYNENSLDATRDGAYAVVFVCLERRLNLIAIGRARPLTGADWYVAPIGRGVTETGEPNLDDPDVRRLEVGGHDDRPSLRYELKLKVRQIEAGASSIPGVAAVVGFKKAAVLIHTSITPSP